ncbi:MAG TPA: transposase [Terriglobia bacterium]|nr:transposase [Terriglobia bacterium]
MLVSGEIFFITCNLLRSRLAFTDLDSSCLVTAFQGVRERRRFLLAGYVFMPDHWHALIIPGEGDTLPNLMGALKVGAMRRVNARRGKRGSLWEPRFFDEIILTVKQYRDTLDYMHLNPVAKGLVLKPEDWAWSSFRSFGGNGEIKMNVDLLDMPADENNRL